MVYPGLKRNNEKKQKKKNRDRNMKGRGRVKTSEKIDFVCSAVLKMPFITHSPKYSVSSFLKEKKYIFSVLFFIGRNQSKFHNSCNIRTEMNRQNYLLGSIGGVKSNWAESRFRSERYSGTCRDLGEGMRLLTGQQAEGDEVGAGIRPLDYKWELHLTPRIFKTRGSLGLI